MRTRSAQKPANVCTENIRAPEALYSLENIPRSSSPWPDKALSRAWYIFMAPAKVGYSPGEYRIRKSAFKPVCCLISSSTLVSSSGFGILRSLMSSTSERHRTCTERNCKTTCTSTTPLAWAWTDLRLGVGFHPWWIRIDSHCFFKHDIRIILKWLPESTNKSRCGGSAGRGGNACVTCHKACGKRCWIRDECCLTVSRTKGSFGKSSIRFCMVNRIHWFIN